MSGIFISCTKTPYKWQQHLNPDVLYTCRMGIVKALFSSKICDNAEQDFNKSNNQNEIEDNDTCSLNFTV